MSPSKLVCIKTSLGLRTIEGLEIRANVFFIVAVVQQNLSVIRNYKLVSRLLLHLFYKITIPPDCPSRSYNQLTTTTYYLRLWWFVFTPYFLPSFIQPSSSIHSKFQLFYLTQYFLAFRYGIHAQLSRWPSERPS